MSRMTRVCQQYPQRAEVTSASQKKWTGFASRWLVAGLVALTAAVSSHADSQTGTNSSSASVNVRIVIPAIIRVSTVSQPETILIEQQHIAQGYIDLEASTLVKITNNTRNGYLLAAQYDMQFLARVDVQISGQILSALPGMASMHVDAGIAIDKLVPISYRLHLAPGVRVGNYRWPVSLAFSLAAI